MFNRLRQHIADLIAPKAALGRDATRTAEAAPTKHGNVSTFEARLKSLAGVNPRLLAGRLNIICLDTLKRRLGAKWGAQEELIHKIARTVISAHTNPDDIYTCTGGTNYVIVFAHTGAEAAPSKCVGIAKEINSAIFKATGLQGIDVKTAVIEVDGRIILRAVSSIDGLIALVNKPQDATAQPPERRVEAPSDATPMIAYRPIWDVSHGVVSTYAAFPCGSSTVASAQDELDLYAAGEPEAVMRQSLALLIQVRRDLEAVLRQTHRLIVTVPLHYFALMSSTHSAPLLSSLSTYSKDIRDLTVIEIINVPHNADIGRTAHLVKSLRPLCRAVTIRMQSILYDPPAWGDCGVSAIGVHLGRPHLAPESLLMHHMARFHGAVKKVHMECFAHGMHSRSVVMKSLALGYQYVDGDAVLPIVPHPREVRPFDPDELYLSVGTSV